MCVVSMPSRANNFNYNIVDIGMETRLGISTSPVPSPVFPQNYKAISGNTGMGEVPVLFIIPISFWL